jgi:hypothetical protein
MKGGLVRWVAAGLNSVHHMVCFFTDPRNKICKGGVQKNGEHKKRKKLKKKRLPLTRVTRGCTLSPLLMVLPHVLYRDGWIERESRRIDTTPETASVKKRETAVFPYLGHLNFRLKTMEVFFLNPKNREIMFLTFHICVCLNHSGGG